MNPETLDKAASLVREMATTLGQPALDVALLAAWAQALEYLAAGVIAALIAPAMFFLCPRLGRIAKRTDDDLVEIGAVFGTVVTGLSGAIATLVAFQALSITAWVSLWHPEVWLALKVLP